MTQYPGPDPDDPFAKAPKEGGATTPPAGTEETAPIQREEIGYWEKLAQEQAAQRGGAEPPPATYQQNPTSAQPVGQPVEQNPWAGYGEPAQTGHPGQGQGGPPPPPPPSPYGSQPPYGAPPPSPYGYGAPGYAAYAPQSHPQSVTALVLGLIGLVGGCACILPLVVAPFAWWIGGKAKREIAASNGQLGGQGNAQAGFVMGIIGTVLLVLGILFLAFIIVLGVTGNLDSSSSYGYSSTEF